MSKGSKVVPIRIPDELRKEIELFMMERNEYSREAPLSLSEWIRKACEEKIAHLKRGRTKIIGRPLTGKL